MAWFVYVQNPKESTTAHTLDPKSNCNELAGCTIDMQG
jgi:hypothetical protein